MDALDSAASTRATQGCRRRNQVCAQRPLRHDAQPRRASARGLRAISASLATPPSVSSSHTARRARRRRASFGGSDVVHARSRNRFLTRRSSSEWKLMIAQRPPGASRVGERGEELLELLELAVDRDAQRLERARRRVDLRLALLDRIGIARATRASRDRSSCAADPSRDRVLDQPRDLARVALLAELGDQLGRARRRRDRAISSSAVGPGVGSIRMSSGPSCVNEKPRSALIELRR